MEGFFFFLEKERNMRCCSRLNVVVRVWRLSLSLSLSIQSSLLQTSFYLPRRVEVQELRHDQVGHVVVHGAPQPDDALREQLRDDLLEPLDDDRIRRGRALLGDDELGEVASVFFGFFFLRAPSVRI